MKSVFEIEWLGGVAERHFRRVRPEIDSLPWGTLDVRGVPTERVEIARVAWTRCAIAEYRAATSFAAMLRSMLEARAPLDLVGMAGDFVADEASHAEIASRIAMELGGGAPIEVDTSELVEPRTPGLDPLQRANEDVMRVSCVHETFSDGLVKTRRALPMHPLVAAAHELIARDEVRHARLGFLYLDWAADRFDDEERRRLANVANETIAQLVATLDAMPSEGADAPDACFLGSMGPATFRAAATKVIAEEIVAPLVRRGILVSDPASRRG